MVCTRRYTTDKRAKNPKKVTRLTFEIQQKDAKLMKLLKEKLGFGIFRDNAKSGGRTYAKFEVSDQPSLKRLMHLFNGNLTLPKRVEKFDYWVKFAVRMVPKGFVIKNQLVKPSLQNAWICCFYAAYRMTSSASTNRNPDAAPRYRFDQKVTLTQNDTHGEQYKICLERLVISFIR